MLLTSHTNFFKHGVLTIGNFDGIHLGHQQIINRVKQKALELKAPAQVMIFEPQPKEFFMRTSAPKRLTSLREKYILIGNFGIDELICQKFNATFRNLTAYDFIKKILVDKLAIKHLIIGEDFKFGCDRKGNYAMLLQASLKYGFQLDKAEDYLYENRRVSSTWVRDSLANNDLQTTKKLLGRYYYVTGKVVRGKKLGRKLNIPTANIKLNFSSPVTGVFATRATLENGEVYKSASSLGYNPSVEKLYKPVLEVHLIDFDGDLYNRRLKVEFVEFLRPELKFNDINALKSQISADIDRVKNNLNW